MHFASNQLVPYLFRLRGFLMSELETIKAIIKANSLAFNVAQKLQKETEDEYSSEGEHLDDSDEIVPGELDESEATDDQRVLVLVDRILRCCQVLS